MLKRTLLLAGVAVSLALAAPAGASEWSLARIKQSGTLKLGYREKG